MSRASNSSALAAALLFLGFTGLGVAFWILSGHWLGVLLPLGFVLGMLARPK